MTPREKAQALIAAYNDTAREFTIPGTTVAVSLARAPELDGDCLSLWLNVTRDGVALNVQNPFLFYNPPLRRLGDTVDRPLLAFLRMVRDAVLEASRCRP